MRKQSLENIFINFKLNFIYSENIPSSIISVLQSNDNENHLLWEFASLQKPTKYECEHYFSKLTKEGLIDVNNVLLVETTLNWWMKHQISNSDLLTFLTSSTESEILLKDFYEDILYFLEINFEDWDYEIGIREELNDILLQSKNKYRFDDY